VKTHIKNIGLRLFGKAPLPATVAMPVSSGKVTKFGKGGGIDEIGLMPVLDAAQLIQPHRALLVQVNELAGVSDAAFQVFYQPVIENVARFVQSLPASEVHHHAAQGGFFAHSLEVCVLALRLRRSYLLSAQHGAEEIAKTQDLWTYAVFLAALCHDLGKAVVGQRIELCAKPGGMPVLWQPYTGFMDEQGDYYRSIFVRGSHPCLPEKVTPLLVCHIVPKQGMHWLHSDAVIFSQWLAAISGDAVAADAIGQIVSQADNQSVANNLGAGSLLMAKPKPLAGKLLTALRQCLASGRLPINNQDATAWIKGNDCWLASKHTIDTVKAHLLQEGHGDIPSLNSQLFDVLQTHGLIELCGDKATWQVAVNGEGWQLLDVTVLRMPVETLWPNQASRPNDFTGNIHIKRDAGHQEKGQTRDTAVVNSSAKSASMDAQEVATVFATENTTAIDNVIQGRELEPETKIDSLYIGKPPEESNPAIPLTKCKPVNGQVGLKPVVATAEVNPSDPLDLAEAFITWLRTGIQLRSIPVNTTHAMVQVVAEGVLLATPGIFQAYVQATGEQDWKLVQQIVLKKHWHQKNAQGLNVFQYQVAGKQKQSTVNGLLLPDTSFVFVGATIPKPNPHFTQITQPRT